MPFHPNNSMPRFFTRKGLITSPECLLQAQIIRCDIFEKRMDDQRTCRFHVTWLQLENGRIIPTVERPDLLPLLEEVLDALEALNV